MSLRILFADDSVTAQNMGRKILTEAGYEVVAVSNGAAAVKKIAEQKPDIIILDVYMPGYSGLEVCEKVRGSMETMKTPVLLTVGKMEPYKPEEASRVRADGVIVKPFEASDLLAIVKKFEERIAQESLVPQPVAVERFYEAPAEYPPEPIVNTMPQATVEVPDHMATSSAFSDLLGSDSGHSMNSFGTPQTPLAQEPPPPPLPIRAPIPEYGVPVSWREQEGPEPEPFSAAVPATEDALTPPQPFSAALPATEDTVALPPEAPEASVRPLHIPVYQEHEQAAAPAEVIPTATAPAGEIEIAREPELQETAAEQTRSTVADSREPDLVPTLHQESAPEATAEAVAAPAVQTTKVFVPSFAELPVSPAAGSAAEEQVAVPVPVARAEETAPVAAGAPKPSSESDFEARVAAAMAAYGNASEAQPDREDHVAAGEVTSEPVAVSNVSEMEAPSAAMEAASAENVDSVAAHSVELEPPPPSFGYYPPVAYSEAGPAVESISEAGPDALPVAHEPVATQPVPPAPEQETAPSEAQQAVAVSLNAAAVAPLAVAAAAGAGTGAGADHHTIAQAVHRVMERLKPELVEEILRELKSKE